MKIKWTKSMQDSLNKLIQDLQRVKQLLKQKMEAAATFCDWPAVAHLHDTRPLPC